MTKVRKQVTIDEEHEKVADSIGLNLSKYLRNKLEEDFPEKFNE